MRALKSIIVGLALMVSIPSFAQFTTGGKSSNNSTESTISTGYRGYVDLGYGIGVGDYSTGRVEFSTTHGYQFMPYFYAGIGAGVNYFHEGSSVNIPIFADFRGMLPLQGSKVAPFLDFKFGYSVVDIEGFYFSPSIGARVAISDKTGFNIGFGYELQKAKAYYYYGYSSFEDNVTAGAITIKLGIDF